MPGDYLTQGSPLDQPQDAMQGTAGGSAAGNIANAIGNYLGGAIQRDKQMKDEQKTSVKYDSSTGLGTIEAPIDVINKYKEAADQMQVIRDAWQKQATQVQNRLDIERKHPWASALAQIATAIAAQDKSPVVRKIAGAASAMNPTIPELEAAQRGVMQEGMGIARGEMEMAQTKFEQGLELTREQRLQNEYNYRIAKESAETDRIRSDSIQKMVGDYEKQARTGGWTKADSEGLIKDFKMMHPELGDKYGQELANRMERLSVESEKHDIESLKRKTAATLEVERQKETGRWNELMKKGEQAITLELTKERFKREEEVNKEINKAREAGIKMPAGIQKDIVNISNAEMFSKDVRAIVEAHPEFFGPGVGTFSKLLAKYANDPDRAFALARMQHLFANITEAYGKARGFAKVEQPIFRELSGGNMNFDPSMVKASLDAVDSWGKNSRQKYFELNPQLDKSKFPGLTSDFAPSAGGSTEDPLGILGKKK